MNNLPPELHEAECKEQPEGFICICDHIKDQKQAEYDDLLEAEATDN